MSNPFQQAIDEVASVDRSINDDDYYIVHPDKKHIVSKVYSKVPYGQNANVALKSYIDSADKRHGAGHKAMKGMHLKHEVGYTRLSETTEYADGINRSVLGSYSTNVDEANYHTNKTFLDTGEQKMSPLDKREMNRRYNKIAREQEKERKAKEAEQEKEVSEAKDTIVKDKEGKVISFKHSGDWEKSKGDGTTVDKSGAKHTSYSKVRDKARAAIKKVSESDADQLDEMKDDEFDALIEGIDQDKDMYHRLIHTGKLDVKKKQKTSSAKSLSDVHKEVKTIRTASEPRNNTYKLHHNVSSTKPIAILKKSGWEHHSGSHTMHGYNSKVTYKHPDGHTITYHHDTHTLSIKQAEQRAPSEKSLTKEDLDEMSAEEFDALIEDFEHLDELSKATLGSYVKKASNDKKQNRKTFSAELHKSKKSQDPEKIEAAREKMAKRAYGLSKAKSKMVPSPAPYDMSNDRATGGAGGENAPFYRTRKESVETLDEIELDVLEEATKQDVKDASGKVVSFKYVGDWKKTTGTGTTVDKSGAKHTPYSKARDKARAAIKKVSESEVDQIDELSKKTLGSYVKAAAKDAEQAGRDQEYHGHENDYARGEKRQKGIAKAVDRMTKEDVEQAAESMVAREQGGRKFVSAEAAIRLAREIAAKRKEGEKATHNDLIAAKKKLVGESVETIEELSRELLNRYKKKSSTHAAKLRKQVSKYDLENKPEKLAQAEKKLSKRNSGWSKANVRSNVWSESVEELDESFEVVDAEGKVVHVAYSEGEAKKHAVQKQLSTGKKHTVRFTREAPVPTK